MQNTANDNLAAKKDKRLRVITGVIASLLNCEAAPVLLKMLGRQIQMLLFSEANPVLFDPAYRTFHIPRNNKII